MQIEREKPSPFRQAMKVALGTILPRRLLIVHESRARGRAFLTFDDGPHPAHTPPLLDVLRELRIPATFFVVGSQALEHPQLLRRMAAEGHRIGNHTFRHSPPADLSAGDLIAEVWQTRNVIRSIAGVDTSLFRPPHGFITGWKLWRLWRAGQTVALWNKDPRDGKRASAQDLLRWFGANPIRPGDVVLLHDDCPHAAAALPAVIREARQCGVEFGLLGPEEICSKQPAAIAAAAGENG